jgi:hypothetical protein
MLGWATTSKKVNEYATSSQVDRITIRAILNYNRRS